jgi:DNA modification methylase
MPKNNDNLSQGRFEGFGSVQSMPKGYFVAGAPNPQLATFVATHSSPYDPLTDSYDCDSFMEAIVDKSDATIYNMHPYWSKKPHGAISQYIRHFTREGDLILDPFTGSGGVNAVACQTNRASIGIDISPAALFIAKHLCSPHSVKSIQNTYDELTTSLNTVRKRLYGTTCHKCGGPAETQYVVWSQRYKCSKCLSLVSHYECDGRNCPHCNEEVSTRQERFGYVPVVANVKCRGSCNPSRFDRGINGPTKNDREAFSGYDLTLINSIKKSDIPYWYPKTEFSKQWVAWRPNLAEIGDVSGFFTERNLWAVASIADWLRRHDSEQSCSWLLFSLTASIMSVSKKAQHLEEGGGYIPGNYVFPPQIKERNVFNSYESLVNKTIKGVAAVNASVRTTTVLLSNQSARQLSEIPDSSIDYIFTDPPYSDKVPFGEFNFLWEVWLPWGTSWDKDEIIVNPKLGKGVSDWQQMMKDVVSELYRVLKPGRWVSVCYHDSSEGSWMHLQDAFAEVGFISEQADRVLSIERNRKSWKQATATRVQKRDLVINFRKPRLGELSSVVFTGDEDRSTFTEKASAIVTESLTLHPGRTSDRLYDEVVSRMVRRGEYERHDFHKLLRAIAEESNGRWYLQETADQLDKAEQSREDNAARRLGGVIHTTLKEHPEQEGVHYSELHEHFLAIPVNDWPRRRLLEFLPEHFIRTLGGTWRLPDKEEAAELAQLREQGTLRRIKRFANALIDGVPVRDKDRPGNDVDLLDWLRQCRRAGLYEQGKAIYEKGGLNLANLSDEQQIEAEDDYRICVRRGSEVETKPKRKSRKKQDDDE